MKSQHLCVHSQLNILHSVVEHSWWRNTAANSSQTQSAITLYACTTGTFQIFLSQSSHEGRKHEVEKKSKILTYLTNSQVILALCRTLKVKLSSATGRCDHSLWLAKA